MQALGVFPCTSLIVRVSPVTAYFPCTSGLPPLWRSTWNVPSGFSVQTVPSELVHVPASAAGPDVGVVAHAPMSTITAPTKIIRRKCCSFMAGIVPRGNVTRQAQIASVEMACPQALRYLGVPAPVSQNSALQRLIAREFAFDVQESPWSRSHRQFPQRRDAIGGSEIGNGSFRLAASASRCCSSFSLAQWSSSCSAQ